MIERSYGESPFFIGKAAIIPLNVGKTMSFAPSPSHHHLYIYIYIAGINHQVHGVVYFIVLPALHRIPEWFPMIFPCVQVARVDLSSAMVNRFRNAARGAQVASSLQFVFFFFRRWDRTGTMWRWTRKIWWFIATLWPICSMYIFTYICPNNHPVM